MKKNDYHRIFFILRRTYMKYEITAFNVSSQDSVDVVDEKPYV